MKNFITNILINIESKLDSALNEINKAIKTQEEAINWSKNFYNLSLKDIKEAEKLGFKKCIIPESNKKGLKEKFKLDIIGVKDINEAMKTCF